MNNIAIIPARSGSKGLKDKNIKDLCGAPLFVYSYYAAKESGMFDEIMMSTDSEMYADIAREYGVSVPFLRSSEQSGDNAGSWGVVREVLRQYAKRNVFFDTVCLLQPTSPLRVAEDICNGYQLLEEKKSDAVTSVCEMEHSPLWSMPLPDDLSMEDFRKNLDNNGPRQNLATYYRLNGALYIRKIEYKGDDVKILDSNEYAYIMNRKRSIDIDTMDDFEIAEYMMKKQGESEYDY